MILLLERALEKIRRDRHLIDVKYALLRREKTLFFKVKGIKNSKREVDCQLSLEFSQIKRVQTQRLIVKK